MVNPVPALKEPLLKAAPAPRDPVLEFVPGLGTLVNDTFAWLETNWTQILVSIAVAIAFYFLLLGVRWAVIRFAGKHHDPASLARFCRRYCPPHQQLLPRRLRRL